MAEINEKHGMTFSELCEFNDMVTFLVLDQFIGHKTFKTGDGPQLTFTRSESNKLKGILCDLNANGTTVDETVKFIKRLRKTKIDLHIRRYLNVVAGDSKFYIAKCDEYVGDEGEGVKVVAKTPILKGTKIKKLIMRSAPFNNEQLQAMSERTRNYLFSIGHIGLGPAAYINHSCEPNAKFVWIVNKSVIGVQSTKPIAANSEILVEYAPGYFGQDCLCQRCRADDAE